MVPRNDTGTSVFLFVLPSVFPRERSWQLQNHIATITLLYCTRGLMSERERLTVAGAKAKLKLKVDETQVWLSSHHPKLAVIISCHTNKTIYVLSCTKVALELLRLLVPPQWRTVSSDGSQPPAAGRDCGTMRHHTAFLTLAAVLWVIVWLHSWNSIVR